MSDRYEYTFYIIHSKNFDKVQVYDETIRECYIGSTRRPDKRFMNHKYRCNNPDDKNYNLKVYKHIRENCGFDNWQISVLETHNITKSDAKIHERWLIELYESELNSCVPSRTQAEYDIDHKEQKRAYRAEHREKYRAYRAEHKEEKRSYDKARHAANRDEINAYHRAYRAANREEYNEKQRARYAAKKAALSL